MISLATDGRQLNADATRLCKVSDVEVFKRHADREGVLAFDPLDVNQLQIGQVDVLWPPSIGLI
jgi:hypothetical protein